MVAEAIPEQEEVKAAAVIPDAPESTPEPTTETPEGESSEEASNDDAVLKALGFDPSATEETTGTTVTGDSPNNPLEGLTAEQIEARGAQRERERLQRESEATNKQARDEGLNRALGTIKANVKDLLNGLDADTVLAVLGKFDEAHGTHLALRQGDVERSAPQIKSAAYNEAAAFTFDQLTAAVKTELGDAAYKALTETKHESWGDMAGHLIKQARKGMVPASAVADGQRKLTAKFREQLKGHGLNLDDYTGNGGQTLPTMNAGGSFNTTAALDRAYGNKEISTATYKAGYIRLTGREP